MKTERWSVLTHYNAIAAEMDLEIWQAATAFDSDNETNATRGPSDPEDKMLLNDYLQKRCGMSPGVAI